MGHTGPKGYQARAGAEESPRGKEGKRTAEPVFRVPENQSEQEVVVPSDTGQPSARSSRGSAGRPGTPLWSPHAPWPAAGHTHHPSAPPGPTPLRPLGPSPFPRQPGLALTIWILSAGRAASGPSPGQALCGSRAVALRAGGRAPGLLLLVEKLALGSGTAWGMGRTVAVGAAGAGVLGGGSRGTGRGAGSSGLWASRRKRW